jgi:DNA mismatch repair protein MutL
VGEVAGTRIRLEGGAITAREPIGAPQGTVITVENLFYNVPARLKFLKSEASERARIDALVTRYALAYPDRRFRLAHDGRLAFQSSGDGDRYAALVAVLGLDTAKQMLEIPLIPDPSPTRGEGRIDIAGYISVPTLSRSNRNQITLFVNGRWVQDSRLSYAIVEAYHGLLMTGRYPAAVVFITLPPEEVDVNVHPAKTEVRFRRPDAIFGALQKTVRKLLLANLPTPEARMPAAWEPFRPAAESPIPLDLGRYTPGNVAPPAYGATPAQGTMDEAVEGELPLLRVVGQVGAAYIIAEGPDGMYLIDQHAAHERILYERFMAEAAKKAVPSQSMLEPVLVDLPPEAAGTLADDLDVLYGLGFMIEPFGGTSFLVRAVPTLVSRLDPAQALYSAVMDIDQGEPPLSGTREAQIIARVCKSAAVKAGQVLSQTEMQEMVRQLEACAAPRTCPHGRPTMIHLTTAQLARQFGRLG